MSKEKNEEVLNLRRPTMVYLDSAVWTEFKEYCQNKDVVASRKIERLIKEFLARSKKERLK